MNSYEVYKRKVQELSDSDPEPKVPKNLDDVINQMSDEEWEVVQRLIQRPKASLPANFELVNQKLKELYPNED